MTDQNKLNGKANRQLQGINKVSKNHIKRLQNENRELMSALLHERRLRRNAYKYYTDRLTSRLWPLWGMYLTVVMRHDR